MKKFSFNEIVKCSIILAFIFVGCHHHSNSNPTPPPEASYIYQSTKVAEHSPGFFSCANLNGQILMGTYATNNGGHGALKCQLCTLEGNQAKVLHTFDGESIYNIRPYEDYVLLPAEQGALWGAKPQLGKYWLDHPKHLRMGHYDVAWTKYGLLTSEKDTISTDNKSQLWLNGKLLYETSDFTWKEFVVKDDFVYVAVYFVWKRTEAGILTVNLKTGEPNLVYSERWGNYSYPGMFKGKVFYGIQKGNESEIFKYPHTLIQVIPDIGWRFKAIGDTFFLTAAEHGWRKGGPSYLYVYNENNGKFEKKLTFPDGEPWDICRGENEGIYYFVTRNQQGNIGRVYKITRH